ncbi:outer membrane protein assembly factor BamB [Pontibacter sp. JAM-7]|uniref:outer membrane protein assembly factor BamB n=1 Tax=Pontibacter sp. JAM-7 TaxID=3366581 RepID=UPI003AF71385
MKRLHLLSAGLVCLLLAGCGFFGDGGDAIKPSPLVDFEPQKQVKVLWSVNVGEGLGSKYQQIQPVVGEDAVYATDVEGNVFAYRRDSGELIWQQSLQQTIVGGVGAGFGQLAVAAENGEVIVLNAEDGTELWRATLNSESIVPAQFNKEIVVFQVITGNLVAFNAQTGQRLWTFDTQIPGLTLRGTSSPIVAADVTFAGFANGKFIAIDNNKGVELWDVRVALPEGRSELERLVDIDARALLVDKTLYVNSFQGRLVAINPFRAEILWSKDISSHRAMASGFGNIYVSEANDAVQAFDLGSSASVWQQTQLANRQITAPTVLGNAVAVGDSEGYIHFMSQVDGSFVARHRIDSYGLSGAPVSSDDVLYMMSDNGRLVALTLE